MNGRVLIAAGSDSGGGAGIQADLKTVTALGGFAATAVTALTAQNTLGVFGVIAVEPAFVELQLRVVIDDLGADCLKTGMLPSAAVIEAVAAVADDHPGLLRVIDPVMVAKGGARLTDDDAVAALRRRLFPGATLITPNLPEAEHLLGRTIAGPDDMLPAAEDLLGLGPRAVLLKGGHLQGDELVDLLLSEAGPRWFRAKRIHSRHTHGTGCTLASAVACSLAQGLALDAAVERAQRYVIAAIAHAPGLGRGHGPLDHGHPCKGGAPAVFGKAAPVSDQAERP